MSARPHHTPAATAVSIADLARAPMEVAEGLAAWQRGDRDEAVAECLHVCAREVHGARHTLWVWTTMNASGDAVWLLPVEAAHASAFAPRGPMGVLTRAIQAAADAGAVMEGLRLLEWHGLVAVEAPGADADHEVVQIALDERQPDGVEVAVAPLDPADLGGPGEVPMPPPARGQGLAGLARELSVHPVEVAVALIAHGQPLDDVRPSADMVRSLRAWGVSGTRCDAAPDEPDVDPLEPSRDPCPRRRHARRLLQRLLRMGKVGSGYHTADDHLYRGAPADFRKEATAVGEALIRAGLLGQKPSVGQRHVYLRREALPEIHALIERGETRSPVLDDLWTAPPPGREE